MHKLMKSALSRNLLSALSLVVAMTGVSHVAAQETKAAVTTKAEVKSAPDVTNQTNTTTAPAATQATEAETTTTPDQATATAIATPSPEQREAALNSFQEGQKSFEEGRYGEAAIAFEKAHQAIPSPHAEYWIAVSLDKADPEAEDPVKIARAYQTLLNNPGAEHIGAEKLEEAKSRYLELRKFLPAKITIVSTPSGAGVTVDGVVQQGVTPLEIEVKEGTHVIELSLAGYQKVILDAELDGGTHLEQQVQMTALPPAPAAPPIMATPEEPKKKNIVPAVVTLGLGGAGLVAGTVFGIMALNSKGKFKDDPTTDNADAAERNALIADMSFGVALTLGITGIVTSKEPAPNETAKKTKKKEFLLAPYASPRGAGAAARLTF